MKKMLLVFVMVIIMFLVYREVKAYEIVIPDTAIRLRVIPNSNSSLDIAMKKKVKDYLESDVYTLLKDTTDIDEARNIINDNIDNIDLKIQEIFANNNYDMQFEVKFGYNYFPVKEYKGIKYDEGYYESLVVLIGEAKGDNWWCVLFPPLCLLESEENSDVEYRFFVQELLNKIF